MKTKFYIKNEITSLDILAIVAGILVIVGFVYIKFFDVSIAEIIAVLVCAIASFILGPLALRQKYKPFYIIDDKGVFQRGRFSKYDAGLRCKGGRFFAWRHVAKMSTEYREEVSNIPWLMIVLNTGENIYFPTMGFQEDLRDEDSFVNSKGFIASFEYHYQQFKTHKFKK